MDTQDVYEQIGIYSSLLEKYFDGSLSIEERKILAAWLWSDRKNRRLLERLRSGMMLRDYYELCQQIDDKKEYDLLLARYPQMFSPGSHRLYWVRWIAAVVLLIIGGGTAWFFHHSSGTAELFAVNDPTAIVLKTSDGKTFHLNEQKDWTSLQQKGIQVSDSLNELTCQDAAGADSARFHQLNIPRGAEYRMILSDGTKVWLNSQSMIRFPVHFGKLCREIQISGEVYLEVHKEVNRPFRVIAGEGKVEVLGTSFGMEVYPEEQVWKTTLAEGSVRLNICRQNLILKPGEMAYVQNGELFEKEVDVDKELAWIQGIFIFEHDPLEEVVKKLSRWYNVEFRFGNEELKHYVFTGQVNRDTGVEHILNLMDKMNVVSFEKRDGYIFIKEKAGNY